MTVTRSISFTQHLLNKSPDYFRGKLNEEFPKKGKVFFIFGHQEEEEEVLKLLLNFRLWLCLFEVVLSKQ